MHEKEKKCFLNRYRKKHLTKFNIHSQYKKSQHFDLNCHIGAPSQCNRSTTTTTKGIQNLKKYNLPSCIDGMISYIENYKNTTRTNEFDKTANTMPIGKIIYIFH